MAINPAVQKKAQEEIDRVIGTKRLPDFRDRDSGKMPYIEAIYRELLRIAPSLPLAVPHSASEDDYYKGYFIPKGVSHPGLSFMRSVNKWRFLLLHGTYRRQHHT